MSIDNFTNWIAFGDFSETGTKEFQEAKHPRKGKGDPAGGEFAPKAWQSEVPTEVQSQAPDMAQRARQYADNAEKFLGTPSHDETPIKPRKWETDSQDFEKPDAPDANAGQELRARVRYLRHFADEVDSHDVVRAATAHGMMHPDDQHDLEGFDKAHAFFTKVRGMMKPAAVATAQKEAGVPVRDWTQHGAINVWITAQRHFTMKAFNPSKQAKGNKA